jgi:hypothetical protein
MYVDGIQFDIAVLATTNVIAFIRNPLVSPSSYTKLLEEILYSEKLNKNGIKCGVGERLL